MTLALRENITDTPDNLVTVLQGESVCNTIVTFNWKVQHDALISNRI
jgi:hypothetical protein